MTMSTFPPLTSKYTNFIRCRHLRADEKPLNLTIEHGRRQFKIKLELAENENGDRLSLRHLAEKVFCETGLIPADQKYYFKNLTWEDPDMGPWSPALRDMGIKDGDKIQLVSFHQFPDWKERKKLETADKNIAEIRKDLTALYHNVHRVLQCYLHTGNDVTTLTFMRRDFESIKERLMENVQLLNSLSFSNGNLLGMARRRELIDYSQRQVDKCAEMSDLIFHKLAQAHGLANVGKRYPRDIRIQPSRNRWDKFSKPNAL